MLLNYAKNTWSLLGAGHLLGWNVGSRKGLLAELGSKFNLQKCGLQGKESGFNPLGPEEERSVSEQG